MHQSRLGFRIDPDSGAIKPTANIDPDLTRANLGHIYFTYMTTSTLITLIETVQGKFILIHNTLIVDDEQPDEGDAMPGLADTADPMASRTVEMTDDMIDHYHAHQDNVPQQVDSMAPMPTITSVDSKIFQLEHLGQLKKCLTVTEQKQIGLRKGKYGQLKEVQRKELSRVSFMDLIQVTNEADYQRLLTQLIADAGGCLNLTHHYTLTPARLAQVSNGHAVTQLVLSQNFQLDDFQWLAKFPRLKLLNLWYSRHQVEQHHVEQICETLPQLEVFNMHSCCRVNLRMLIPLFSLRHLNKLAIDDPHFWCQKSIHELFILPHEWKNMDCASLRKLAINSQNLTLDVLDYIITAAPGLTQVLVDADILSMVSRNIITGYDQDRPLTIHAWQNPTVSKSIIESPSKICSTATTAASSSPSPC